MNLNFGKRQIDLQKTKVFDYFLEGIEYCYLNCLDKL